MARSTAATGTSDSSTAGGVAGRSDREGLGDGVRGDADDEETDFAVPAELAQATGDGGVDASSVALGAWADGEDSPAADSPPAGSSGGVALALESAPEDANEAGGEGEAVGEAISAADDVIEPRIVTEQASAMETGNKPHLLQRPTGRTR